MTDKERLVELIWYTTEACFDADCAVCKYAKFTDCREMYIADHLIANGVVVQKQGEWLPYPSDMDMACSVCGMEYPKSKMPKNVGYCPNCGAKMVKEDK